MAKKKKWKPERCPFCGNENIVAERNELRRRPLWWMQCSVSAPPDGRIINIDACMARGPVATTMKEARALWNKSY